MDRSKQRVWFITGASTAGKTRQYLHDQTGKQGGDPAKAAAAIIAVVEAENPPKHLILGKMAYTRMAQRIDQWKQDLEAWREVSLGAGFDASSLSGAK